MAIVNRLNSHLDLHHRDHPGALCPTHFWSSESRERPLATSPHTRRLSTSYNDTLSGDGHCPVAVANKRSYDLGSLFIIWLNFTFVN